MTLSARPFGLSQRQLQIALLLAHTDKEISARCGISVNTVKKRVKQILKRTAATTRTAAALQVQFQVRPPAAEAAMLEALAALLQQLPLRASAVGRQAAG